METNKVMKKYTVGFVFNRNLKKVLLVHKLAPEWQVGYINGVGGKVEKDEEKFDCVVREVKEETGIESRKTDWQFVGTISGGNAVVDIFGMIYQGKTFKKFRYEKEDIEWFPVNRLPANVIPNLKWMIPLTVEKLIEGKIIEFKTNYTAF